MTPLETAVLVASSVGGGMMNALAGGGTILVFPTLIFLGEPSIVANATSTVGLLPGAAASMFGYRREVVTHRDWLKTLLAPSLLGGALGSVLLLRTPEHAFARLAPLLVLFATVLFMLQGLLARRRDKASAGGDHAAGETPPAHGVSSRRWLVAVALQFAVAVYGGYFGAAVGILMLAILGFLGLSDILAMNGLKNFFGMCINGIAAGYFILRGIVDWPAALLILGGAVAGGYGGARLARRIGREKARAAVVVIGLFITALLYLKQAWNQAGR
jgi:uncharacterized membrane protein YfcA